MTIPAELGSIPPVDDGTVDAADAAETAETAETADVADAADPQPAPAELTTVQLEALLFVAERPLTRRDIATLAGVGQDRVDDLLGDLEVDLAHRGIRILASGEHVALSTAPEAGSLIARWVGAEGLRLSPASLETLPSSPIASPPRGPWSNASGAWIPTTSCARSSSGAWWSSSGAPTRPAGPSSTAPASSSSSASA